MIFWNFNNNEAVNADSNIIKGNQNPASFAHYITKNLCLYTFRQNCFLAHEFLNVHDRLLLLQNLLTFKYSIFQ